MVEIQILPAQEVPKQLTARKACETLGEHYEAFLLSNNITGWQKDDHVLRDDNVLDILFKLSATTGLYSAQLKEAAREIYQLAKSSGNKIKLGHSFNMAARALGYPTQQIAQMCRRKNGFIPNMWPYGAVLSNVQFSEEIPEENTHRKIVNLLLEDYRRNLRNARQLNKLKAHLDNIRKESRLASYRLSEMKAEEKAERKRHLAMPITYRDL